MVGNITRRTLCCFEFWRESRKMCRDGFRWMSTGLPLSESDIQLELDKRKPGQSIITTQRKEEDIVELISGIYDGHTTGAPICALIWNKDADSRSYESIKNIPQTKPRGLSCLRKIWGLC